MSMHRPLMTVVLAVLVPLGAAAGAGAQELLITHARIIVGNGQVIERGSIEKSSELGTLEAGKLADIVLFEGNPLEGYWHLLNAKVVVKGGEIVVDKR